jgi:nucleotidyltransferase substrate binding protein (TIGR01987 family)
MTDTIQTPRWHQRRDSFRRALGLLREPLQSRAIDSFSLLEQQGLVQRFEFSIELTWKTLKDLLEFEGVDVQPVTPKTVIKMAFAAQYLADGQVWIDMIDDRNRLSHMYDENFFRQCL